MAARCPASPTARTMRRSTVVTPFTCGAYVSETNAIRTPMRIGVRRQAGVKAVLRLCNGGRWGKHQADGRAFPRRAFGVDPAIVGLHQMLDDGKPEAGAPVIPGAGGIGTVEPLEDAGEMLRADPGAGIPDLDDHALARRGRPDGDRSPPRRVAQGVVVEVGEDLAEGVGIHRDGQ